MNALLRAAAFAATLAFGLATAAAFPSAAELKSAFHAVDGDGDALVNPLEWEAASHVLFKEADKNHDGYIEANEVQSDASTLNVLTQADLNKDGRLDRDEYVELRGGIFIAVDIDNNDFLDLTEYELLRLIGESGWSDTNKNGRIELPELRVSLRKIFADADLDMDNRLSPQEANFLQPADFKAYAPDGMITLDGFLRGYKVRIAGD